MDKQIDEMQELADLLSETGSEWNEYINECQEKEQEPKIWYYDFHAKSLYEQGYRKQEWISVEERLPDKEGEYLVFTQNKNINVMPFFTKRDASAAIYGQGFCVWERGRRTNDDDWWKPVKYVTHWMPLPQKPKMKGAE
jgi:hypothetical protein